MYNNLRSRKQRGGILIYTMIICAFVLLLGLYENTLKLSDVKYYVERHRILKEYSDIEDKKEKMFSELYGYLKRNLENKDLKDRNKEDVLKEILKDNYKTFSISEDKFSLRLNEKGEIIFVYPYEKRAYKEISYCIKLEDNKLFLIEMNSKVING